jgi:SAM-dependent methyltransferase
VIDLSEPALGPELMDSPHLPDADLERALADIAVSNRWLGGVTASIEGVADLLRIAALDGHDPVTVLDVGAGGADVALSIIRWARRNALAVRVLAVDIGGTATRVATEAGMNEPWLEVTQADAFRLPFPAGSRQVVHASMFLHHIPRPDQAGMLERLAGLATVGTVVTDLLRTRWAHVGVSAFGALTRRGHVFRNDAPLSVARGFTLPEARELAERSGVRPVRVRRHPFSRLSWTFGPVAPA